MRTGTAATGMEWERDSVLREQDLSLMGVGRDRDKCLWEWDGSGIEKLVPCNTLAQITMAVIGLNLTNYLFCWTRNMSI